MQRSGFECYFPCDEVKQSGHMERTVFKLDELSPGNRFRFETHIHIDGGVTNSRFKIQDSRPGIEHSH